MTCIAWDGSTLAADRMCADEWVIRERTKIALVRGHLVGCAGNSSAAEEMVQWFAAGAVAADFPASLRDRDNGASMLAITPDRRTLLYQAGPYPIELQDERQAIGSGADAALAAMRCGRDATAAVEVAAKVCRNVGCGVDVLRLEERT